MHFTGMSLRNTESFNPCLEKATAMTTALWKHSLEDLKMRCFTGMRRNIPLLKSSRKRLLTILITTTIKELNREAQKSTDPAIQLQIQLALQEQSKKQKKQRQEIFTVEDEITEMRDKMIAEIQLRMKQKVNKNHLFTINWQLI